MGEWRVGVLGATSLVGEALLPRLAQEGWHPIGYSRRGRTLPRRRGTDEPPIEHWVSLMPLWALPSQLETIAQLGARRLVAVGSTSRFTKTASSDPGEQAVATRLANAEQEIAAAAQALRIGCTLLRPTLIYGFGRDRNVSDIARVVRRFGLFPVAGAASGLRQPVHATDVAAACAAALARAQASGRCYDLSGAETLTYREMVERIFEALGRRPRIVSIPLWGFAIASAPMRLLPRWRHVRPTMAQRMNVDQVFDHADAARDLDYRPRPFRLDPADLPGAA